MSKRSSITHAMTIDVEDYFQVSAFANVIEPSSWDSLECRVEKNTQCLLELFANNEAKATFFILGWVAKRYPQLLQEIVAQGHEVASHGMMHQRASEQTAAEFRADVSDSKKLLEDITGVAIMGYRAPSFSFTKSNMWVYDNLAEAGYLYSSSVYPVVHDHYGIPDAPRFRYQTDAGVDEIPLSTLPFSGKNMPISGGGYFRLYPYAITAWAIKQFSVREKQPYIFYLHPWEVDPDQPRVANVSWKSRFRHYLNLRRVEHRMQLLLSGFEWSSMADIYGYSAQNAMTESLRTG